MKDWRDMPEFTGIDLEDSFVLSWQHDIAARRVFFELEVSLWFPHPRYEIPPPEYYTCYRTARLIFDDVHRVVGLRSVTEAKGATDSDGTVDYGNIEGLRYEDGIYRFDGEVGEVEIECRGLRLEFDEAIYVV